MRRVAASLAAGVAIRTAACAGLWLAGALSGWAHAADHAKDAAGRPIMLLTPGGALQDALQKSFFAPFTAQTHIPVHAGSWDGTLAALQDRARSGGDAADRDLVLMDNASVLLACRQGLLLPIPTDVLPAEALSGQNRLEPDAVSRCGIGGLRTDLVLAWDRSRIDTAPGWSDFWDVARRPGKRGLARDPRGTLEIALLADGVPPDEIYRTLATDEGLDRAFHKLDQLKPYIVWWDTQVQAMRIIESGSVLMTSASNDAVVAANLIGHRDFAVQWQQSLDRLLSWAMPGRPPPVDAASGSAGRDAGDRVSRVLQLLQTLIDPARQADFVERYPATSVLRDVPGQDTALGEDSPATSEHRRDALRQDDAFWAERLDPIRARFNAWIGQ